MIPVQSLGAARRSASGNCSIRVLNFLISRPQRPTPKEMWKQRDSRQAMKHGSQTRLHRSLTRSGGRVNQSHQRSHAPIVESWVDSRSPGKRRVRSLAVRCPGFVFLGTGRCSSVVAIHIRLLFRRARPQPQVLTCSN